MLLSLFERVISSISFITFLIAIAFGLLALMLVYFPPNFLQSYPQLSITDPNSIQFILTFTIGGVFTLTIFTYTMVMNVLNRSISNYSPRLIPLILHERHHQMILGITSGTLIYCLVLSVFISSEANREFPSVAAPLAIAFGVLCVFSFIYFIHAVSQSIHVNYIIRKSFGNTKKNIQKILDLERHLFVDASSERDHSYSLSSPHCGYLNAIRREKLLSISRKENIAFELAKPMGSFVLEGEPILYLSKEIDSKLGQRIKRCLAINRDEPIDVIEVGFKHLVKVAVKACSPAINDPWTALIALDYLTQLFILRKEIPEFDYVQSSNGGKIFFSLVDFAQLKHYCFEEMETYMVDDPILKKRLEFSHNLIDNMDN